MKHDDLTFEAEEAQYCGDIKRAMELYRKAIAVNPCDSDSMRKLARLCWAEGEHEEAVRLLKEGAKTGAPNCAERYAIAMLRGDGCDRDERAAIDIFKNITCGKNAFDTAPDTVTADIAAKTLREASFLRKPAIEDAIAVLGACLIVGIGGRRDVALGEALCLVATGNSMAKEALALLNFIRGKSDDASKLLKQACVDSPDARILAAMTGVVDDTEESWRNAAKGDYTAYPLMHLAMVRDEAGDREGAAEARARAALLDDEYANDFAVCWSNACGLPRNYCAAAAWHMRGVAEGGASSMRNLSVLYLDGKGVEKDEKKAFELAQRAASTGGVGFNELCICFWDGIGTDKDGTAACESARHGAVLGDDQYAYYNYADCVFSGVGTRRDYAKAFVLTRKCARRWKEGQAYNRLGVMYSNGLAVQEDAQKAVKYYRLGANAGDNAAMMNLAECYQNGCGVEKDEELAAYWRQKAEGIDRHLERVDVDPFAEEEAATALDEISLDELKKATASEGAFRRFFAARCPQGEAEYLIDLIDGRQRVMMDVVEYMLTFNLDFSAGGEDEQGYLDFKDYLYFACACDLKVIVRCEAADEPELVQGKLYDVLKLTETGDYIIVDESGSDWTHGAEKFEIVRACGESSLEECILLRVGEAYGRRGKYYEACEQYAIGMRCGSEVCARKLLDCYVRTTLCHRGVEPKRVCRDKADELFEAARRKEIEFLYIKEKSIDEAVELYERAADEGSVEAASRLAALCLVGKDVPKDEKKAMRLLKNLNGGK